MYTIKKQLICLAFTGLLAAGLTACSEQSPSKSETITYSPVGPVLDRSYRVNGLYVSNGNTYLTIAGRTDGPLRYAVISAGATSATPYKIVDLMIPMEANYKLVGPLFVDVDKERLFAPVVVTNSATNTYAWLPYDSKALTPTGPLLGNYPVPSNTELQFGVAPPGFYKNVIYPNYAGNLVGINTINGQQVFQKNGILAKAQSNYAVIENQILTFSRDSKNMLLIDMTTGREKNVGDGLNKLSDQGYKATPFFAVFNGAVYLLMIDSEFKPGLCTTSLQSKQSWECKSSDMALPEGAQITAFNVDAGSGTPYFLTTKMISGTQLNKINLQ